MLVNNLILMNLVILVFFIDFMILLNLAILLVSVILMNLIILDSGESGEFGESGGPGDLCDSGEYSSGDLLCTLFTILHSVQQFVHYLYTIEAVHYWTCCWIRNKNSRDIGSKQARVEELITSGETPSWKLRRNSQLLLLS